MPKRRLCRGCRERVCKSCNERFGGRFSGKAHLYLAVDDWSSGYSIRKIKLPSGSDEGGSGEGAVQPLPPALVRTAAERGSPQYFTSAFGKIVVMHSDASEIAAVPIIDVHKRTFMFGPDTNCPSHPIYIPVGTDKLFAMDIGSFEVCYQLPERCLPPEHSFETGSVLKPDDTLFSPLDQSDWSWCLLQDPPFDNLDITSYAVDEQEKTIFFSTKGATVGTFTFNIGESVWKSHSRWALPFSGRGYFDPDLNGFVGLSKDPGFLGYLYFCDMTRTDTGTGPCPYPNVKCSKVKVFDKNPAERHLGASLLYMQHCKFCIVGCVSIDDVKADQAPQELISVESSPASIYMYHVITFSIRYDKRSDLKVENYRVRCYEVPREATNECIHDDPVAFWL
ncbi:unnamed protein product [Urochloa decumbens]|uniref:Uncharacterized protein n=1 Tax=Urochloa decumbens TaxID=240449 RepID=A0ABC8ZX59_9POAL